MEKYINQIEFKEIVHQKNNIISSQTKRINLLEDKLDEIRQKYFQLKRFSNLRGFGEEMSNSI